MTSAAVTIERRDRIAVLTLAGHAWNTVGQGEVAALARACEALHDDADVRVVVVRGAGAQFCGGWSQLADEQIAQRDGVCCLAFEPLATLPQPVIAAIGGPAHGAGLELALAADVRLASTSASFMLCEGESLPLAGGLTRLSRAVGRAAATWMALTGAMLSAEEALRAGLVSAVLPAEGLVAEADRLAAVIAARGPIAVRYAKEAVQRGADLTLAQALRLETDLTVILQTTADRAEGVAAFVEKRQPQFRGE
jgi:enoyl-CoA hydratase/carnithine racemase